MAKRYSRWWNTSIIYSDCGTNAKALKIHNENLETLQYLLYKYMREAQNITNEMREKNPNMAVKITPRGVRMTITMITTVPILLVYPFLQRYLIKGLLIGAVNG